MIRPALIIAALPIAVWMLHPTPAWPDAQTAEGARSVLRVFEAVGF